MRLRTAILALSAAASAALAQTPSFTVIQPAPGSLRTSGEGVSGDGSVVTGFSNNGGTRNTAFRWSTPTGRIDLVGPGIPTNTIPNGISGNGGFVFGTLGDGPFNVFRWSGSGGYEDLGSAPGWNMSFPTAISGDGSVIAGYGQTISGGRTAAGFRWTQAGGYQPIPQLRTGSLIAEVHGMSRDGNVIVGYSQPNSFSGPAEAFRWSPQGGTQQLIPAINPLFDDTQARAVSGNGMVIVGSGRIASINRSHPFIWTEQLGMVDLGLPAGAFSAGGLLTNFDGSTIIGSMSLANGDFPFIWRQGVGFANFNDYLVASGVVLPTGYGVLSVTGVSDDGMTFVGSVASIDGTLPIRAYVATVPSPGSLSLLVLCSALRRRR